MLLSAHICNDGRPPEDDNTISSSDRAKALETWLAGGGPSKRWDAIIRPIWATPTPPGFTYAMQSCGSTDMISTDAFDGRCYGNIINRLNEQVCL